MKCPHCKTEIPRKPEPPRQDQEASDVSDRKPLTGPCPQCGLNVMWDE